MPCSEVYKKIACHFTEKFYSYIYERITTMQPWIYMYRRGLKWKRYKVTKLENKLYMLKLFVVTLCCRLNAFIVVVVSPSNTYIFLGFLSGFGIFFRDKIKRMVSWSLKRCSCLPFLWSVCFIRAGMACSTLKRNTHVSFKSE